MSSGACSIFAGIKGFLFLGLLPNDFLPSQYQSCEFRAVAFGCLFVFCECSHVCMTTRNPVTVSWG